MARKKEVEDLGEGMIKKCMAFQRYVEKIMDGVRSGKLNHRDQEYIDLKAKIKRKAREIAKKSDSF